MTMFLWFLVGFSVKGVIHALKNKRDDLAGTHAILALLWATIALW